MFLIFARLVNSCWFCFKWGLVLGVIGLVVALPYLYGRLDEEIRCRVEERLAEHYPGLKVKVRSAELVEGEGIEVRGLSIVEPGAGGPRAELISVDELFLRCPTDWQELIEGRPPITEIALRRAILRVTRRPDGTFSVSKLLPPPKLSESPPKVTIEDGMIEIFDPLKSPASTLTLRQVNLAVTPVDVLGRSGQAAQTRRLRGTFNADYVRRGEVEGRVDMERMGWAISGTIEGLEISPKLREALPGPWTAKLGVLGQLRGQATLAFHLSYDPDLESPCRFELSGRLERGRIDDPRLPHPLTDMRATVSLSNEGVTIDELVARSGQATLRMSARQAGFELGKTSLALNAEIRQLELDRRLFDCLPESLQQQWHKYRPAGKVDADVKLSFDGRTWRPDLAVRCLNASFSYHKFPYRLEHGEGIVQLKDDFLQLHLTAHSGIQPVWLDAEVFHPMAGPNGWVGWFEAKGDDLQLDEKLVSALKERPQAFVRSLNPRGAIGFHVRLWRDEPGAALHKTLTIGVNHCAVRYDKFPYPLGNVRGTLVMRDDHWTFSDLEGTNDTGRVKCTGCMTSPRQRREVFLRLVGTDIPLEEELRDALRPDIQRVWNEMRPRGSVNLLAEIRYLPDSKKLSISVRAEPQGESTSVEPVHFPYRMEKLQGVLVYQDGQVMLQRLKAEHGPVKIAAGGHCEFSPDGRWNLQLQRLWVDRLRLEDRELAQALPGRLKAAVLQLKPTGPVHLRGTLGLQGGAVAGEPIRSQWNLEIDAYQGGIDCGIKLENLNGSVTLAGGFDGRRFHSRGELAIDSLTYRDYQFTQVMGPLWIDDQQVLLGSWVDRWRNAARGREESPPRPLTARLFGGTVWGDGWVTLGPEPRYGLHATLSQADLGRVAQEVIAGRQNLRGKIVAAIDLRGSGRSRNVLSGYGTIRLREADVWELPLMIALLKILSIRPPDPTAFSKSDIDFRIEGEHVYFDRISFNGDAISLVGRGEMDFQSAIRLTFHAIVGRDEIQVPVLREVMGGASEQIMQIQVEGTLQNPETRKVPFPRVNEALQQLQDDIQRRTGSQGLFPQARRLMPNVEKKHGIFK